MSSGNSSLVRRSSTTRAARVRFPRSLPRVGDVPLSSKRVRLWARQFDTVQMQGIHFLYMIKRLGFGGIDASLQHGGRNAIGRSATFNALLRLLHRTDAALFNGVRMMLPLAGRYFIRLGK